MKVRTEQQVIHRVDLELDESEMNALLSELGVLREEWFQMKRHSEHDLARMAFREAYPKLMEFWEALCT